MDLLWKARKDFIDYVSEQVDRKVTNFKELSAKNNELWTDMISNFTSEYKIYTTECWELAEALDDKGYNILEQDTTELLIAVALTLEDYLCDHLFNIQNPPKDGRVNFYGHD